jgi:hypothetical protein
MDYRSSVSTISTTSSKVKRASVLPRAAWPLALRSERREGYCKFNTPEVDSSASLMRFAYPTSVGAETMDDEHRHCSDAINSLLDVIATKSGEGVPLSMPLGGSRSYGGAL